MDPLPTLLTLHCCRKRRRRLRGNNPAMYCLTTPPLLPTSPLPSPTAASEASRMISEESRSSARSFPRCTLPRLISAPSHLHTLAPSPLVSAALLSPAWPQPFNPRPPPPPSSSRSPAACLFFYYLPPSWSFLLLLLISNSLG